MGAFGLEPPSLLSPHISSLLFSSYQRDLPQYPIPTSSFYFSLENRHWTTIPDNYSLHGKLSSENNYPYRTSTPMTIRTLKTQVLFLHWPYNRYCTQSDIFSAPMLIWHLQELKWHSKEMQHHSVGVGKLALWVQSLNKHSSVRFQSNMTTTS